MKLIRFLQEPKTVATILGFSLVVLIVNPTESPLSTVIAGVISAVAGIEFIVAVVMRSR